MGRARQEVGRPLHILLRHPKEFLHDVDKDAFRGGLVAYPCGKSPDRTDNRPDKEILFLLPADIIDGKRNVRKITVESINPVVDPRRVQLKDVAFAKSVKRKQVIRQHAFTEKGTPRIGAPGHVADRKRGHPPFSVRKAEGKVGGTSVLPELHHLDGVVHLDQPQIRVHVGVRALDGLITVHEHKGAVVGRDREVGHEVFIVYHRRASRCRLRWHETPILDRNGRLRTGEPEIDGHHVQQFRVACLLAEVLQIAILLGVAAIPISRRNALLQGCQRLGDLSLPGERTRKIVVPDLGLRLERDSCTCHTLKGDPVLRLNRTVLFGVDFLERLCLVHHLEHRTAFQRIRVLLP